MASGTTDQPAMTSSSVKCSRDLNSLVTRHELTIQDTVWVSDSQVSERRHARRRPWPT